MSDAPALTRNQEVILTVIAEKAHKKSRRLSKIAIAAGCLATITSVGNVAMITWFRAQHPSIPAAKAQALCGISLDVAAENLRQRMLAAARLDDEQAQIDRVERSGWRLAADQADEQKAALSAAHKDLAAAKRLRTLIGEVCR